MREGGIMVISRRGIRLRRVNFVKYFFRHKKKVPVRVPVPLGNCVDCLALFNSLGKFAVIYKRIHKWSCFL